VLNLVLSCIGNVECYITGTSFFFFLNVRYLWLTGLVALVNVQDDNEKVVDVFPDFIQYGELYSTSSRLIFSSSSLKLEGPTNNQTGKTFKIEWETEDIIKIESCWFEKVNCSSISFYINPLMINLTVFCL